MKNPKIFVLRKLAYILVTVISVANAAGPDLSGSWELDKSGSDFGSSQAPECSITRTITQKGAEIDVSDQITFPRKVENISGTVRPNVEESRTNTERVKFSTDGRIETNLTTNATFVLSAEWKDRTLFVSAKGTRSDGQAFTLQESWILSANGDSLQIKQNTQLHDYTNTVTYLFRRVR